MHHVASVISDEVCAKQSSQFAPHHALTSYIALPMAYRYMAYRYMEVVGTIKMSLWSMGGPMLYLEPLSTSPCCPPPPTPWSVAGWRQNRQKRRNAPSAHIKVLASTHSSSNNPCNTMRRHILSAEEHLALGIQKASSWTEEDPLYQ